MHHLDATLTSKIVVLILGKILVYDNTFDNTITVECVK